ncbi:MAG: T9SS type A sorting domain-containing protein [Bacteroidota bacterium]
MKKLVLLSLVMSIALLGFSQERVVASKALRDVNKTAVYVTPTDAIVVGAVSQNPYVATSRELEGENTMGNTFYDLQSNTLLSNRIYVYDDGSIGTVWTRGVDASAFADRGTGYNFFDGTSWGPDATARIEDDRVGWPSYAPLGANGEIVVAHLADGLKISTRTDKGTGEWAYQTIESPVPTSLTWPRMTTAGEDHNTVHLLVNTFNEYEGQAQGLLYYRSLDAGATWDIEAETLEGTGADFYSEISADSYIWADPRGGAIAFLVAATWTSDMFLMKSTDNGDSWEKTIIWEHPYPFFDWEATIADTFYCVDNSANITLDNEGNAHVVFGISRVMHYELGTTYNYFPYVDGIGYWNETMPMFSKDLYALNPYGGDGSEMVDDYNLIGWFQDTDGSGTMDLLDDLMSYRELGLSTMPSIAVDDYGTIMLAYSSTTEGYDNTFFNYKHVWVRSQQAGGAWGDFEDINTNIIHMFDECIYPLIGQNIDPNTQTAYIMYNADFDPGLALDEDHEYVDNRTIVANFNLITGVEDAAAALNFTVSQNVPNPAVYTTTITVGTEVTGAINLSVSNLLGQVVYQENVVSNSHTHSFNVNVSNFDSGIYFYTIEIGNSSVTKKMLVK